MYTVSELSSGAGLENLNTCSKSSQIYSKGSQLTLLMRLRPGYGPNLLDILTPTVQNRAYLHSFTIVYVAF